MCMQYCYYYYYRASTFFPFLTFSQNRIVRRLASTCNVVDCDCDCDCDCFPLPFARNEMRRAELNWAVWDANVMLTRWECKWVKCVSVCGIECGWKHCENMFFIFPDVNARNNNSNIQFYFIISHLQHTFPSPIHNVCMIIIMMFIPYGKSCNSTVAYCFY